MTDLTTKPPEQTLFYPKLFRFFWGVFLIPSFMTFLFGGGHSVYEWLRNGVVETIKVSSVFPTPQFDWVGIQAIISYIWSANIIWAAFAVTLISYWPWSSLDEKITHAEMQIEFKSRATK